MTQGSRTAWPFAGSASGGLLSPVSDDEQGRCLLTSPYLATLDQIEVRFATNDRRRALFDGLKRYVALTRELANPPLMQFISGSFVDQCEVPGDIDVANIVDAVDEAAMPLLFDKPFCRSRFGVDPFAIALGQDRVTSYLAVMRLSVYYSCDRRTGRQRGYFCIV